MSLAKIYYTITDEAPALATHSFLNVVQPFLKQANLSIEKKNISLAYRILAVFPEYLKDSQQVEDALAFLGEIVSHPDVSIIKLPNISASLPQLKACIVEWQKQGYPIPDYTANPQNQKEQEIKERYDKVKGSSVNPILREGNSDRRVAKSVKEFAQKNPHSMGVWSKDSKSHVTSMSEGDFYGSEKSTVLKQNDSVSIVLKNKQGNTKILKKSFSLLKEEVIDCSVMSLQKLKSFIEKQIQDAKDKDVLFSVHLKATMMKVSDPIFFGAVVKVFYRELFKKFSEEFSQLNIDANDGIASLYEKIKGHPKENDIKSMIQKIYQENPGLAMVNSDLGITSLHAPNDLIIDASMPAMIRNSGQMWNTKGKAQDTKAVIPDRSYASVYQASIDFCKKNGAFDPSKMGSVANVGLMAKKAEEYGSHDKTFQACESGVIQIVNSADQILLEQPVEVGDVFRMCQTKDEAIENWVKLAVERAFLTQIPAIFWLDENRSHDAAVIQKVNHYLKNCETQGLELSIKNPKEAIEYTMERSVKGLDTISVTGNVLRDYLTDLFPILELGTSAKMLSIVPLLKGGGLFETGAGGSAPKHVEQFLKENYLRWDSLGEFLALAVCLENLGHKLNNERVQLFAQTLDAAISRFLENDKSPTRSIGGIDNRGSHFYLAFYWANELTCQNKDEQIQKIFQTMSQKLQENETTIVEQLLAVQGQPVNLKGYYAPCEKESYKVMNPSTLFLEILKELENLV